jgi:hypothetical protein
VPEGRRERVIPDAAAPRRNWEITDSRCPVMRRAKIPKKTGAVWGFSFRAFRHIPQSCFRTDSAAWKRSMCYDDRDEQERENLRHVAALHAPRDTIMHQPCAYAGHLNRGAAVLCAAGVQRSKEVGR